MAFSVPRSGQPLFKRLALLAAWKRLSTELLPVGLLYAGTPAGRS